MALANHVNGEKCKQESRQQLANILPVDEQLAHGLLVPSRQLLQTAPARLRSSAWWFGHKDGTLLLFSDLLVFCAASKVVDGCRLPLGEVQVQPSPPSEGEAPDLLLRTGGQLRLSNFLLYECAYAELAICEALWPDFGDAELAAALREGAAPRLKQLWMDQADSAASARLRAACGARGVRFGVGGPSVLGHSVGWE